MEPGPLLTPLAEIALPLQTSDPCHRSSGFRLGDRQNEMMLPACAGML
jgi:hypothetical protein